VKQLEVEKSKPRRKNQMNFKTYIQAGYSLLWLSTSEEERAITQLSKELNGNYKSLKWNLIQGLTDLNGRSILNESEEPSTFLNAIPSLPENCIIFALDFHKFFQEISIIRACKCILPDLRSKNKHIVFISHALDIPPELEKDITIFDFELPTLENLISTAEKLAIDNGLEIEINPAIISSAKGLTQISAENAFARSLIEFKDFRREILEDEKQQNIKKSGFLEIYKPEPIESIGGLQTVKDYIQSRKIGFTDDFLPTPRGILLAGLPGCGKSLLAKAISSILGISLLRMDFAALKGGLVGESESNLRNAFKLISAMGNCVVWWDEIEKALSGVQSSGKTDGGTTSNLFGMLLTWMQESSSGHYIVATCNEIDDLLAISQGAFIRRFDDVFFVDLPNDSEIQAIHSIMCKRYNVKDESILNMDTTRFTGYTGAEIEKIIKSSLYDGLELSLSHVKPIAIQNKAVIDRARAWASNNAILANKPRLSDSTTRKITINQ
jgi:hypothetical protein